MNQHNNNNTGKEEEEEETMEDVEGDGVQHAKRGRAVQYAESKERQ